MQINSKAADDIKKAAAAAERYVSKAAEQEREYTDKEQEILDSLDSQDGQWEELDVVCPFCDSSQYVYVAEDNRSCYCVDCGEDFTASDIAEMEDGDTSANYLTSDYAAANSAASEMIDKQITASSKAENCSCGLPAHFGECKAAMTAAIAAQDQTGKFNRLPGETKKEFKKRQKQSKIDKASSQTGSSSSSYSSSINKVGPQGYTFDNYKADCYHSPFHAIAGDGWGVWIGKKDHVKSHASGFDVIINLAGFGSIKQTHSIPIPQLEKWETYGATFREIILDWPDYGTVYLPRQFWEELTEYLKNTEAKCLIFCQGGHGRTGTAIATMLVVALGWTAEQAITWVRKQYCAKAIETVGQENYIKKMARVPETKQAEAGQAIAAAASATAEQPTAAEKQEPQQTADGSLLGKMLDRAKQTREVKQEPQPEQIAIEYFGLD